MKKFIKIILEYIQKDGKVYRLDDTKRTAPHRLKIAKRFFRLIWEQRLDLIQRTIGFLMNRRSFSFLTKMIEKETLNQLPPIVYEILPNKAILIAILLCIFIEYITTRYSKFTMMIKYHQKKNH